MSAPFARILGPGSLALVFGLVGTTAIAGGFHGKTVLVPVVAAPTMATAAAPTYSVIAASPYQVLSYSAAPSYQLAAVPIFQPVSAPVYQMQTTTYAAPSYYHLAAPSPTLQYQQVGSSPSAMVPPVPYKPMIGRLTDDEFQDILVFLKNQIASLRGRSEDEIRKVIEPWASLRYKILGRIIDDKLDDKDVAAIKELVNKALSQLLPSPAPSPGPNHTSQVQLLVAPVSLYAAPAPTQLFLPVMVKPHHFHPFK